MQPSDSGAADVIQRIDLPAPGSPISAPDGCEVLLLGEDDDGCSYHVSCEARTFTSNVNKSGAEWSTCYTTSERSYTFSGIEGTDACAFATNFCVELPETLTSTPVCEVDIDATPEGTCQYINQCTQAVDLGFGVTAKVASAQTMLSCFPGQSDGYDCGCSGDTANANLWHVVSLDGRNPCDVLQPLCFEAESFPLGRAAGSKGECVEDTPWVTPDQCQIAETCTYSAAYGPNASLSVAEDETSQCVNGVDGWNCDCNASGVRRVRFSPLDEPEFETLCYDALDVCRQPTIEGSGALTCSEALVEDVADGCEIDFECEQPVTAGPHEVLRKTSGSVVCDAIPDGWTCNCRYGAEWETWTLDTPFSSVEACSQAAARCSAKLAL